MRRLSPVTKLLLKYGAYQAANLDGGSSTIMVYRDEIITKDLRCPKLWPLLPGCLYRGLREKRQGQFCRLNRHSIEINGRGQLRYDRLAGKRHTNASLSGSAVLRHMVLP